MFIYELQFIADSVAIDFIQVMKFVVISSKFSFNLCNPLQHIVNSQQRTQRTQSVSVKNLRELASFAVLIKSMHGMLKRVVRNLNLS